MSDDILKLYKSITSKSNQQQSEPQVEQVNSENSSNDKSKIKSQINYLNININDYLTINKSSSQVFQNRVYENENLAPDNLKRKREKCSKGLRHFSMKVCEKVKQKSITTYNQVAEELVNEYCLNQSSCGSNVPFNNDLMSYDQKNVRRRVYDALNVLMAMNIISKEKKEIRWIGLPCNTKQECQDLEIEKKKRQDRIEEKSQILQNLIVEHIAFKSLIERNKKQEKSDKIQLPFVTISTDSKTSIECNISSDRKEYSIHLDNTFEISTDISILKKLGFTHNLGENEHKQVESEESKQILSKVPTAFQPYVSELMNGHKMKPICLDQSEIPNFSKVLKPDLFESNKAIRYNKKNTKMTVKSHLIEMNSKDEDSNELDRNEDTDTNGIEESDDENSFENYEDEEYADGEYVEEEEDLGDDDDEDDSIEDSCR